MGNIETYIATGRRVQELSHTGHGVGLMHALASSATRTGMCVCVCVCVTITIVIRNPSASPKINSAGSPRLRVGYRLRKLRGDMTEVFKL